MPSASRGPATQPGRIPEFTRIWLVVMENKGYEEVVGNGEAPYLNGLIDRFGLAQNAHGVARPSQPNYLALFSGSTHEVADNDRHDIDAPTIADQLEATGRTWSVFAENVPPDCFEGPTAEGGRDGPGTYERKHEPAISFISIASNPARCAAIRDFTAFAPNLADFSFIVPNLCHDMHDCSVAEGDAFLASFLPRITDSTDWKDGGLLVVTFDEGDTDGGLKDRVATIVISPHVAPGSRSDVDHSHYSVLRTIQEAWGLPCLAESCSATPLAEFFTR